jgi:hypothetical protein
MIRAVLGYLAPVLFGVAVFGCVGDEAQCSLARRFIQESLRRVIYLYALNSKFSRPGEAREKGNQDDQRYEEAGYLYSVRTLDDIYYGRVSEYQSD